MYNFLYKLFVMFAWLMKKIHAGELHLDDIIFELWHDIAANVAETIGEPIKSARSEISLSFSNHHHHQCTMP